jgi:hypothetical protein
MAKIGVQRQYTLLESELIEAAKISLADELYSNASFLCEKLLAEVSNEEVKLLLGESYLGNLKAKRYRGKQTI